MNEFLQMGGYASYIWSAYGLSAVVLIALVVWSLKTNRDAAKLVAALEDGTSIYQQGSKPAPSPASSPAEPVEPLAASDQEPK